MVNDVPSVDQRAPRARRGGRSPYRGSPKRILVVNDHFEVRSVIIEFLRRRGLIAIPVRDAASARVVCERIDCGSRPPARPRARSRRDSVDPPDQAAAAGPSHRRDGGRQDPELARDCRALAIDEILVKPIVLRPLEGVISRLLKLRQVPTA